jgi:hypothetical protein
MCSEILQGSRMDLLVDALDDGITNVGCEIRRSEHLPPMPSSEPVKLLEEVLNAALAACKVPYEALPHDPPAQALAPIRLRYRRRRRSLPLRK